MLLSLGGKIYDDMLPGNRLHFFKLRNKWPLDDPNEKL
jgi:hypothetical protein